MATPLPDIVAVGDLLRSFVTSGPAAQEIEGFPFTEYQAKLAEYEEWEQWFNGEALKEYQSQQGKSVPKYPVQINPIYGAALKHAYALWGEFKTDSRPLAPPKVERESLPDEGAARAIENALNMLWYENHGRALLMENGLITQVYGGSIIKVSFVPWENWRNIPVRLERIHPKNFYGIPDGSDPFRLREAWILKTITEDEARDLGVEPEDGEEPLFVEYWNRERYMWTINGEPCTVQVGGQKFRIGGDNPYGIVPVVYFPRVRSGQFWGDSLVPPVQGVVKELNLRVADIGDAVSDQTHQYAAMRNVNGSPVVQEIAPGLPTINLGSNPQITGSEREPDLFPVKRSEANEPMLNLSELLYQQFRRDAFLPAVADGEDEGSQRSALTLHTRFWPLVAITRVVRTNFDAGLNWLHTIALRMLAVKKLAGITDAHLKARLYNDWAPILPRDREAYVNEIIQRMQTNLGSPELLLELLGDVEDVPAEVEAIKAWLEFLNELEQQKAEAQAEAMARNRPAPGSTTNTSKQAGG